MNPEKLSPQPDTPEESHENEAENASEAGISRQSEKYVDGSENVTKNVSTFRENIPEEVAQKLEKLSKKDDEDSEE